MLSSSANINLNTEYTKIMQHEEQHKQMFESLKQDLNEQISKIKCLSNPSENIKSSEEIDQVNFASETLGAEIISIHDTPLVNENCSSWLSDCTFLLPWRNNPVRNLLKPSIYAGECFAFKGSMGNVTVKLMGKVLMNKIGLGHITRNMSPTLRIDNAPKLFSLWALDSSDNNSESIFCGEFEYNINNVGNMFQIFSINPLCMKTPYEYIRLDFLMNHGNENTCVYR